MYVNPITAGNTERKIQLFHDYPLDFQPTRGDRGWLINPAKNPFWTIPASLAPALLATILIFMDQQITAVIVNRKENKLKVSWYKIKLH